MTIDHVAPGGMGLGRVDGRVLLVPLTAPVIDVVVDCTDGPGRGATICDTRGKYRAFTDGTGGNCRVVLETDGTLPDVLVRRLIGAV